MELTPEAKRSIDAMSYENMLRAWRFAPIGDQMFQGETGEYFAQQMAAKRKLVGDGGHTAASKRIGWDAP